MSEGSLEHRIIRTNAQIDMRNEKVCKNISNNLVWEWEWGMGSIRRVIAS